MILSLKNGTFLWFTGATTIVHFDGYGNRIQTFEIPTPPAPTESNQKIVVKFKKDKWAFAELSDHTFGVLYDIEHRKYHGRGWCRTVTTDLQTKLMVFDHVNRDILYDDQFEANKILATNSDSTLLYVIYFEKVSLLKILNDGGGFELIMEVTSSSPCIGYSTSICELENGLLVIAINDDLYLRDSFILTILRRLPSNCEGVAISNNNTTGLEVVHKELRLGENHGNRVFSIVEVSANILMIRSDVEGMYEFWDMSDRSVNPQLVYTFADGINRGPAIRLQHFTSFDVITEGFLVFEGTMQLWDWSTKRFITNKSLIKAVNKDRWDSSIVELQNGSIVLTSEDSVVLWRFPNRYVEVL